MKNVIVHYHIFKNAGSTIDWILTKNFVDQAGFLDGTDPEATLSGEVLLGFLETHPNCKSVSSHQLRFPLPSSDVFHFIPWFFIRHPIDRAFSVYHFLRRMSSDYYFSVKARNSTMKEFFQWYLDLDHPAMRNIQTVILTKQDNFSQVDMQDYKLAVERIKKSPIFGIVERMDESLVLAEDILNSYFPGLDLSYSSQNVNPNRLNNLRERISSNGVQIGERLIQELESSNTLDMSLHTEANSILDERIQQIDNFEEKLLDFKYRCKKLQQASS